jgi:prepilin-type N-terminal cleavage/methylation domain-containing protein/prepilin-type processing-associated H-X9-DG protein
MRSTVDIGFSWGNGLETGVSSVHDQGNAKPAFTLIEVLVVIGVIGVLIAILVPSLSTARNQSRSTLCQTNLRTLGQAWGMYADESQDIMVPARWPRHTAGGFANEANWYPVSTGLKYRPRWPVLMQKYVGVPALLKPLTYRDRQNYDSKIYVCPSAADWTDERNSAYGYNYQFLGSLRVSADRPRKLAQRSRIRNTSKTVVIADSMGSAAAFPTRERLPYENAKREEQRRGNYGWLIDPPRLDAKSSRAGGPRSKRSAPDPRHRDRVNVVFADDHGELLSLHDLGYGVKPDGLIVDSGLGADNRLFSGTGEDMSPP